VAQRRNSRQNYIAKMNLRKQRRLDAGLVSDVFPTVDGMVIHMTYLRKGSNPVVMLRTVNVFPSTYAYFIMDCMTPGCTDGGFDLTPVIREMVREHKKVKKGKLFCSGESADAISDHANVVYEVAIKFNKKH
jgi:hypothetical protein